MYRWSLVNLISLLATLALPPVARGDTGSPNTSESPSTPHSFFGSGGSGLVNLLNFGNLRQATTDQQGIDEFLSNAAAFALTNIPLSGDQIDKAGRPLVHVPVVFSPLVVLYKIPAASGILQAYKEGELRLDKTCLNGIYTCSIRTWNDPHIVALNPSLAQRLQNKPIVPWADDDTDSTTRLFKQYVWESSAWSSDCVNRVQSSYNPQSMLGSVFFLNYSIGYTAFASALSFLNATKNAADPLGMAASKDANGSFVAPSKEATYPFRAGALPKTITSRDWALVNVSASGETGAYPMGGLVYVITDANLGLLGSAVAGAMKQFLLSLFTPAFQGNMSANGGILLPHSQVLLEQQQIEGLSTIPPPPVQSGGAASTADSPATIIGAVVGSTVVVAVLLGVAALCHVRRRRRMQMLQITESIKAWRDELAKEGLLVQHTEIQYECVPGSKTKYDVLGEGTFGKVYKAKWNGTPVAVKVLKDNSDSQRAAFVREANMLQALRHPNIVCYMGCAITDHNEMLLVLEFMGGGDLAKAMKKESGGPRRFSWNVNGRFILLGVARGLAFIHSQGITHFDVKPGNVLLDKAGIIAKITDVGQAKVMAGSNANTLPRGTAVYMAPEQFPSSDSICKVAVTQAADIYSFGVLMWEVLTGERSHKSSKSLRKVRVPEECPPSMDALWKRCIAKNPQERPSADEVMAELTAAIMAVK
ncbi:probable serine/threonine-protein kinase DDB_G0281745 at C-terminar half [Coccomyxa sp. Obi]|nr:probable serine/threonine-protein kinase DDB_G0281745 at C-terminar half [Coccomyxa sp. Obi]